MKPTRITYDPEGDTLYITFGPSTAATGYQLSDQILLRIDPETETAAGLTIFNFFIHTRTRSEIPLPGLEEVPQAKPLLLETLSSPPVSHFLKVIEGSRGISAVLLSPSLPEAVAV